MATGLPHASYLSMTELEREAVYEAAVESIERAKRGR